MGDNIIFVPFVINVAGRFKLSEGKNVQDLYDRKVLKEKTRTNWQKKKHKTKPLDC